MPIWPFKPKPIQDLTIEEVRDRLIAAASGSKKNLRVVCEQYKDRVAANLEWMSKMPDGLLTDPASLERYVPLLITVAQCLANECNAPELWSKICGTPEDNPLLQWERWFGDLPRRMEGLEHDELIVEARSLIEQARTLQGHGARQNEAFLHGRLGELLFHSGKVFEAIKPFQTALELCREIGDVEGQMAYLLNLLEASRYLGDVSEAVTTGEQLIELQMRHGMDAGPLTRRVRRIRAGEPLCRIICVKDDKEWELDEITGLDEGRYEFQFRRNRLSLQKATILARQGSTLATSGRLADALAKYQEASEVDPHDPDPVYQSGVCLLELGAYSQAREAFEEVERIAPGWYRSRSDKWLARSLEDGLVSVEEFRLLRTLEDGGLDASTAIEIARRAIEMFPGFAPFYLALGDLQRDRGETADTVTSYRAGLELVVDPDLESRLLCALAGMLPSESPDRKTLIDRALGLEGSFVAQASARLIALS
jgi:tetratricopeptide (TPR) repeat protein